VVGSVVGMSTFTISGDEDVEVFGEPKMLLPKPSERKRPKHEVEHVASIRDTPGIQHLNPACHLAAYYVYLWLRDDCHAGDLNISVLIGALNPDQLAPHVRRLPNFELPENPTNKTWRRAWRMLCAHTLGWNERQRAEEGDHDRFNARVNIFLHTHFFPDNDTALVSPEGPATPMRCRRRRERPDLRSGPVSHEMRAFKRLWLEPLPPPPPLNFMLPDAWVTPVSLPLCPDSPELDSPRQSTQAAPQHAGSRSPRRLPDWMSHTNETCDDYTINLPTKIHSTYPSSTSKRSCVRRCTRDPCTHLPYKTKW
jgi:hypothetical protein